MQFSTGFVLAAVAAMAQAVKFDFDPAAPLSPVAGEPITLNWSEADGPVTITLKNGPANDLKDVMVITSGQTSGSFTWTPPADIPTDVYALEISDDSDTNYSGQFSYVGEGVASTATPSATTSSDVTSATITSTTSTPTGVSNTTMTTSTTSSSSTTESETSTTTSDADTEETTVANTNGSQRLASSLALVVGAVAAFAAFN